MVEKQRKPETPSAAELWLEERGERVKLPDEPTMRARLKVILPAAGSEEDFFPLLLRYAGQTMPISHVPAVIVDAIRIYVKDEAHNLRHFVEENVPHIIDAMIVDPVAQQKARVFLVDALNG